MTESSPTALAVKLAEEPKHILVELAIVIVGGIAEFILTVVEPVLHPVASFTVTVYIPVGTPVTVDALPPVGLQV